MSRKQNKPGTPSLDEAPSWFLCFLDGKNAELAWELPGGFFKQKLESPATIVLLDGHDEAPDQAAWPQCKFIVTTTPHAYKKTISVRNFTELTIALLQSRMDLLYTWA